MPNIATGLAGLPDVSTPRPRETPNSRDDRAEQPSFGDAFAERARARDARPSNRERQNDDQAPEEQPAIEPKSEAKRGRAETGRRAAAAEQQAQSGKAASTILLTAEIPVDPNAAFFDTEFAETTDFAAATAGPETLVDSEFAAAEAAFISLPTDAAALVPPPAASDPLFIVAGASALLSDTLAVDAGLAESETAPAASVAAPAVVLAQSPAPETAAATNAEAAAAPSIEADPTGGDARKADDAESESQRAPILTDVSDDAAADLQPAVAQTQAAAAERTKVKTHAAARELESIGELAPQSDRAGPAAAAHSAPETRLAPVHTQASVDAAAQVIAAIRSDKGSNEIDVRLDPPELGRVKISFSFERSDIVTATVSSERTDTLDLMRRHQDELARELERAGFSKVRLDFSAGDSGRAFSDQPRAHSGWRESGFGGDAAEDVRVHYLSLRTDNRLDRLV